MPRPDDRPLRRLPQLESRKADLERCVFCPKLCRSSCPVSNVDTRETVTPWGKMSMAYFVANESVALAPSFADPAGSPTELGTEHASLQRALASLERRQPAERTVVGAGHRGDYATTRGSAARRGSTGTRLAIVDHAFRGLLSRVARVGPDPGDPRSFLKVDQIFGGRGGVQIEFTAVSNRAYSVQFKNSLALGPWSTLLDFSPRLTNRLERVLDPVPAAAARVYRLAIPQSPGP